MPFRYLSQVSSKSALELINRWGLVPESAWSVKFTRDNNSFEEVFPHKDALPAVVSEASGQLDK